MLSYFLTNLRWVVSQFESDVTVLIANSTLDLKRLRIFQEPEITVSLYARLVSRLK